MAAKGIDELVAQLLISARVDPYPPIDLRAFASALGVQTIEHQPMVEDGRLERHGGVPTITVRAGVQASRQRFTIAHELGHLVLATHGRDFVAHRMWPGVDQEERFCDEFAAALLLPRVWVISRFRRAPVTLQTARNLAETTGASLSASVVRLRELVGWRHSLLHWRRSDGQWRLASTAGVPRDLHNRITSTAATREVLEHSARQSPHRRTHLPIAIDGVSTEVNVELSIRGRGAIALALLASDQNPQTRRRQRD